MFKPLVRVAGMSLFALSCAAHAATVAQWNFNDSDLAADLGVGTIALVGGTSTSGFNSGSGSSDPVQPGIGWSISSFAAQSSGDRQRGAQFTVSTLGLENIVFTYDMRHSNTASAFEVVQYSTNGTTFADLATFQTTNGASIVFNNGRSVDLSSIVAADNQAALTLRVVAAFAPGTGAYAATNPANTYATNGTMRFDMVTISGTVAAVPEPESYAMLLAGLAALAGVVRRQRRAASPASRS